jgi:cAMP-dependent protein kinase regulator
LEGLLVAKNDQDDTLYQCYQEGDYFGELALIKNKPRQMSVVTVTKCKLVWLSSSVFLNVINIEKANIEISQKYRNSRPRTLPRRKKYTIL